MAAQIISANTSIFMQRYATKSIQILAACFILSGATGLIYEVLWARMLGLVFGGTTLAVSTVLAAFMGGLALGSAIAGRLAVKIRRPIRAYGVLEIGIALYALAVPFMFALVDDLYAVLWQHFHLSFFVFSLLRFLLSCLMLLIPTTLMGATLPLMSAALLRSSDVNSTSITKLYTRNLVGAICGCIAAGFFLLPSLGVTATIYTASVMNMVIGLVAILADRRMSEEPAVISERHAREDFEESAQTQARVTGTKFWLLCAFVSGFVTISTQVAWTRMLSMIIGSSTYAFSITVALFLVGLSVGAFFIARRNVSKLRKTVLTVELLTAISLVFSLFVVNRIPAWLVAAGLSLGITSWGGLLALQIASVALLILLPALLMGMVMPLVLVWTDSAAGNRSVQLVGRSYAVNTIGAIAGAFSAGFVLIPRTSTRFTILFAAALCVMVAGLAYQPSGELRERKRKLLLHVASTLALLIMIFTLAPRLDLANLSIGAYDSLVRTLASTRGSVAENASERHGVGEHALLMYVEGTTSTVSVRKDWDVTSMAINGRVNASDREDMPTQVMLGQLPILIAPNVRNGLVVGFASGVTVGSILQSPIHSLECVELEPATVDGSRFFEHVNNRPLKDPRMRLIIDDARTYLRVTPNRYDLIVSEPSHPWVPGVANLFTKEFFTLGRERLSQDGVFVQWVQIYQLSTDSLRSVLATFQNVFPYVQVFRVEGATYGKDLILIGSKTSLTLDLLKERMADPRVAAELGRVEIKSEADVKAWYVCDQSRLSPAVAGAVINTDDNMHVETTVPREAFRPLIQSNVDWIEKLSGN
ncbi:MAG TPA: fused MFS/spermidine synthase [Pyrinomonadaceae bacterium]|nr:fused MFS/spermidine synthase [Pyrinomonadaceae bacterium]